MQKNLFLYIFIALIAIIILVAILYFSGNKEGKLKANEVDIKKVNLIVQDSGQINEDKYSTYSNVDTAEIGEKINVNLGEMFSNKEEPKEVNTEQKSTKSTTNQNQTNQSQQKERVVVRYVNAPERKMTQSQPQSQNQSMQEVKQEAPTRKNYGFTQTLGSSRKRDTAQIKGLQNSKYINVFLEEATKITDHSTAIFILNEDATISGRKFPAMSILYAQAKAKETFFDIVVYQVMDIVNGNKYPVHLVIYNENYGRGVKYEGNFNKAIKSESSDAVQQSNLPIIGTYTQQGVQLVKNTVQKLQGPYSISLSKNWNCYVSEEQ